MSYLTPDGRARGAELRLGRASGIAVLAAVIRGIARRVGGRRSATSGATSTARSSTSCCRSSIVLARDPDLAGRAADLPRPRDRDDARRARTQTIARGPVASQIAIKQLGTNGGGFYNSNSAVPFENPTALTNFLEMLSILLIPVGAGRSCSGGWCWRGGTRGWSSRRCSSIFVGRRRRRAPVRAARLAGAAQLRREHHAQRAARAAAT